MARMERLGEEFERSSRHNFNLSFVMVDIDYFKNYNDTYGHPAGDEVLQRLSDLMQRATSRAGEVVARYGARDNIRCNTLAVGQIESNMTAASLQSEFMQDVRSKILLGRFGTPEEVAAAVVFLASEAGSYITAQTINVNGGLYF